MHIYYYYKDNSHNKATALIYVSFLFINLGVMKKIVVSCLIGILILLPSSIFYFEQQCEINFDTLIERATNYQAAHEAKFRNKQYITVIDYTLPSFKKRMCIVNTKNGMRNYYLVSHGHGGRKGNVYAPAFSNQPESYLSSLGFMKTGGEYKGKHGRSLKLHGLQAGLNDKAEMRSIVLHAASYVNRHAIWLNLVQEGKARLGESQGCPAVNPIHLNPIIDAIKGGSLVYIHGDTNKNIPIKEAL